jgi:hypothetical protein
MKFTEEKTKHLEFVLKIIERMAANSFYLKGWTITLNAAMIALVIKNQFNYGAVVGLVITYFFWILDAYYLSLERKYRLLYDQLRTNLELLGNFSLDISHIRSKESSVFNSFISLNLVIFFGMIMVANIIVILITI